MSNTKFVISASGLKNIVSMKNPEIIKEADLKTKNVDENNFFFLNLESIKL